jgi:type VI secretion system FHA domain protein
VHAQIECRDGAYAIRNVSKASALIVDGQLLAHGEEAGIADGVEICIGAYILAVEDPASQAGDEGNAGRDFARASGNVKACDDPLTLFGTADVNRAPDNPFSHDTTLNDAKPASFAASAAIPDDFDPLGGLTEIYKRRQTRPDGRASLNLEPSSSEDIDKLFGLNRDPAASRSAEELFGAAAPPGGQASNTDPMVLFGGAAAPEPTNPPQRDTGLEIHGAFVPPTATFFKPAARPADAGGTDDQSRRESGEESSRHSRHSMFYSWDTEQAQDASANDIKTMIVPSPQQAPQQAPKQGANGDAARQRASATFPDAAATPAAPRAPRPPADELLQAFLDGAGVPDLAMPEGLSAETMRHIGKLLRAATQGVVDLLLARALLKRELRADMTMLRPHENNPLKFSPNAEAALHHLLAPRGQGFMPPQQAMEDAINDLRAHQMAVMAGMRAALQGVLERFDPANLEERLTRNRVIDALLLRNRKAQLWDLFLALYSDITTEAEEEFHQLFGREFLSAYEAQLDRLAKSDAGPEETSGTTWN